MVYGQTADDAPDPVVFTLVLTHQPLWPDICMWVVLSYTRNAARVARPSMEGPVKIHELLSRSACPHFLQKQSKRMVNVKVLTIGSWDIHDMYCKLLYGSRVCTAGTRFYGI
jgi:hypothetical protein